MAKRECEQPLVALLPPCKRPLCELPVYSRHCTPHTVPVSPKRKRKMEPEVNICEKLPHTDGAPAASLPPSKKLRPSESRSTKATHFQCQKDEAFREYNSFHFWRTPLPDMNFSELGDGNFDGDRQSMSTGADVLEEMDN